MEFLVQAAINIGMLFMAYYLIKAAVYQALIDAQKHLDEYYEDDDDED